MAADSKTPKGAKTLSDGDIATFARRSGPMTGAPGTDSDSHATTDVDTDTHARATTDSDSAPQTDRDS